MCHEEADNVQRAKSLRRFEKLLSRKTAPVSNKIELEKNIDSYALTFCQTGLAPDGTLACRRQKVHTKKEEKRKKMCQKMSKVKSRWLHDSTVSIVYKVFLLECLLWGYGTVVAHPLCMRKVPGSIPGISTIFDLFRVYRTLVLLQ